MRWARVMISACAGVSSSVRGLAIDEGIALLVGLHVLADGEDADVAQKKFR